MKDVYLQLARHLQDLIMGYPYNEALTDLLKPSSGPVKRMKKRCMESRAPESFADLLQRIRQEKETAADVHN